MAKTYHDQRKQKNMTQLRGILAKLPVFLGEFFRGIADQTTPLTRTNYAKDLKLFFEFLQNIRAFGSKELTELSLDDLNQVNVDQIEEFMEYISYYENEKGLTVKNDEKGKSRKFAAIRSLFGYFYKKQRIQCNPAEFIDFPKIHDKTITRLEPHEIKRLLDEVESGEHLTEREKKYHQYTRTRDLALITLLLGTGMRVSECVGIDLDHINFELGGIKVIRKGGDESIIYFGDEVAEALHNYLEVRLNAEAIGEHKKALFLSMQKKRLTDRAIEKLVKKYSQAVIAFKKITPHKFRSTYGTSLYKETGDIYLVASVLGHSDVNTTRKHYAHMDEERKRNAVNYVKLR